MFSIRMQRCAMDILMGELVYIATGYNWDQYHSCHTSE